MRKTFSTMSYLKTITTLLLLIAVWPLPAFAQTDASQQSAIAALKILGVIPTRIEPSQTVRIFLSSPLPVPAKSIVVEIGGKVAKILDTEQDTITVQAPTSLRCCNRLSVRIFGGGLSVVS